MKVVARFALILSIALAFVPAAFADTLTLGSAASYTVLGLKGAYVHNSLGTIYGNEGIAQSGSIKNEAPFTVTGNVDEYASGQLSGPGHVNGSVFVSPAALTQNNTDAMTAWTFAKGLTASSALTFTGLNSGKTINATGALTVIDINGNVSLNNANLILNGNANDYFVVNISGNLSLVGSAKFGLGGTTSANHVLYNFTGSNCTVSTNIGDGVIGTMLGPHCTFNLDGVFTGQIIGGDSTHSITLLSGAVVNYAPYTPPVPEPASFALLATGLAAIVRFARRRK